MTVSSHPSETILRQLGGHKFIVMTGATDFVSGDNPHPMLRMRLPASMVKGRGSYMEITLEPSDTYKMVLFRMWSGNRKLVDTRRGVYVDSLRSIFTDMTGLDTSLGTGFDRREMLTANGAG